MNPFLPGCGGRVGARLSVSGVVQGVGFRPFVFSLAQRHAITGWVRNTSAGVEIMAEGAPAAVAAAREAGGEEALHFLRDATRGGLTTVLAELAEEAGVGIEVEEEAIPVSPAVRSVCDLLGCDPLTLANEGKMVLVVAPAAADAVVAAVQKTRYGREARRIGFVTAAHPGRVALSTPFGTRRVLDMPVGELLPRTC